MSRVSATTRTTASSSTNVHRNWLSLRAMGNSLYMPRLLAICLIHFIPRSQMTWRWWWIMVEKVDPQRSNRRLKKCLRPKIVLTTTTTTTADLAQGAVSFMTRTRNFFNSLRIIKRLLRLDNNPIRAILQNYMSYFLKYQLPKYWVNHLLSQKDYLSLFRLRKISEPARLCAPINNEYARSLIKIN